MTAPFASTLPGGPPRPPAGPGRPRPIVARLVPGLAVVLLVLLGLLGSAPRPHSLPAIVFVSRQPVAGAPLAIPGFGPTHRAAKSGGRLLVREPDGRVRELLPAGALFDVSDPAVARDARRIAFAGTPHPDSGWRIYLVPLTGGKPVPVTSTDSGDRPGQPFDDLDPCWISNSELCFASTRQGTFAQYADVPVTNLYRVRDDGGDLRRITSERNGAEEPAFDRGTGRIVYSRWWFNRYRPARDPLQRITTDPAAAVTADSVNLWQAVEITPEGEDLRLACGAIGSRAGTMVYQPAVLAGGSLCGVYSGSLGLWPHPGGTGIHFFPQRYGENVRLAGAIHSERAGDPYSTTRGLAPTSACSPAGLADGRILIAHDRGGRGDFGLYVLRAYRDEHDNGGAHPEPIERVLDLPGTLELDPAPVLRTMDARPRVREARGERATDASGQATRREAAEAEPGSFTFECANVFAQGGVDSPVPEGPRLAADLTLRFFAVQTRVGRPDTAILIRENPVAPDGSIRAEGLPSDTPMFEQLVDRTGAVLMGAHGPAHVAGLNWGPRGATVRCVGCHLGHSTLEHPESPGEAAWFNAAPSARVTGSTVLSSTAGARGAVDRRTQGDAREVAWIGQGSGDVLRLAWDEPLEVRELVLYAPRRDRMRDVDLELERCELRLFRGASQLESRFGIGPIASGGRRVKLGPDVIDALEIRFPRVRGRIEGEPRAALAEVEVIARRVSAPRSGRLLPPR